MIRSLSNSVLRSSTVLQQGKSKRNRVIIDLRIFSCVRPSVEPRDVSKFVSPIEANNVTLLIDEKKIVASKEVIFSHFYLLSFEKIE